LTSTSVRAPARWTESATSRTIAASVVAEMLTVPAQAACSWEQEIVIGGSLRTG